jgi:excinuclease ABC subunit C
MDMALSNAKSHFADRVAQREHRLSGLEQVQTKLQLPELPQRMECFDISHFQGDESVASQVVFEEGLPKSDDYRRYKIRTVEGNNDFASMKEVLSRRFQHTEYDDPQLLVVDGGKGQLKMALEVLNEIGRSDIPVVGMAKARAQGSFTDPEVTSTEERFFLPGRQNPVSLNRHPEALKILVNLRDEAHRFAITYHRKRRDQKLLSSQLDEITGLGPKRKKILIRRYRSVEQIRKAKPEDLARLPQFNLSLAEKIINFLIKTD